VATYKLIQDIEAEDKILGPLTLRQFIFALITAFFGYLCFICIAKHVYFMLAVFAPPMLLGAFFAFPFGRDQPTEVWALAKLRFWFKPRRRLWNQSGVKELVTITVPKKVERVYTDGLSQTEVQSRLKALANTIDSRGWATKNINITSYAPNPLTVASSDRLLDISDVPDMVPDAIVQASDDILDEQNNPIAQQFDTMIAQSSQMYRQQLVDRMNETTAPQASAPLASDPSWFFTGGSSNGATATAPIPVTAPAATIPTAADDPVLAAQIHAKTKSKRASYGNLRTLQPLSARQPSTTPQPIMATPVPQQPITAVTAPSHPAILALANNDDFNVSTIAREAKKAKGNEARDDEVVISLH
jgi:hypothetical protein